LLARFAHIIVNVAYQKLGTISFKRLKMSHNWNLYLPHLCDCFIDTFKDFNGLEDFISQLCQASLARCSIKKPCTLYKAL
jgi:hypothetical protein